jgi:hypothetical protein
MKHGVKKYDNGGKTELAKSGLEVFGPSYIAGGQTYYVMENGKLVKKKNTGRGVMKSSPSEVYTADGKLLYVKGPDGGMVKPSKAQIEAAKTVPDGPQPAVESRGSKGGRGQDRGPKSGGTAAKPKAEAAKPKPAPKREEVKMEKMKKREAGPIATKKSEIKLAEPKGEMKSKESETKETPRQAATRKRSAKKEGKQQARKDTRAAVAKERKETKSLRDEIAVAKTQARGDKRVTRAKSKKEKLEARLKALRS